MPPLPPITFRILNGLDSADEEELRKFEAQMAEYEKKMKNLQREIEEYVQKVQESIDHEEIQEMIERQLEYVACIDKRMIIEIENEVRDIEGDVEIEIRGHEEKSRFDNYFDWLSDQLVKNGYLESRQRHFTFELKDNKAKVNDKEVKEKDRKKYQKKYEEIFDRPMRSRLIIED